MTINILDLPYTAETAPLLHRLQDLGGLVALESKDGSHENGRWSIICAEPLGKFSTTHASQESSIEKLLNLQSTFEKQSAPLSTADLPFTGGLIGATAYDFGSRHLKFKPSQLPQPTLIAGYYSWAYLIDHRDHKAFLVHDPKISSRTQNELADIYTHCLSKTKSRHDIKITHFKSTIDKVDYEAGFEKTKTYINSGDVYQINYTQSFKANYKGNPLDAHTKLKEISSSPYLAYMDLGKNLAISSISPEQFLKIDETQVSSKPIKGTMPRSTNQDTDRLNIEKLKKSKKDTSENLMIVDLLRNDLSISCSNIQVPSLFEIESFELVHHLVSTIQGQKRPSKSQLDVFFDAFPGGSITGAPKRRAMEIIEELEYEPRGFYCGSIFYFSNNNKHQSNILIRTFTFNDGEVTCNAGGGIVADSNCDNEYQESLDKISRLMLEISS